MCVEVRVGNVWCSTVGELRAAIPCEPIKEACYQQMPRETSCLCGIDIPATLASAGVVFTLDETANYVVKTTDERAEPGEKCCKELADRRWHDDGKPMPTCGHEASYVLVVDGVRLAFCAEH